jgi:Prp8 binding protein
MTGHKGAILDLHWSRDSLNLFSASADTTLASWDLETGQRIRRHEGHTEIVNCMTASPRGEEILISGSDDGCVGIWDPRVKRAVDFIETDFPITSVAVADAGNEIYTGGIDCDILAYDFRKKAVAYRMPGHTDTVTSLSISPDSQSLLSYSHDGMARTWDIRPFAPVDRSQKTFGGAPVGIERNLVKASWDTKGEKVGVGSGDGSVCVWEARTAKLIYKLPGHKGTVNDVRFAPGQEPISKCYRAVLEASVLMTCSRQRFIRSNSNFGRIGELALLIPRKDGDLRSRGLRGFRGGS